MVELGTRREADGRGRVNGRGRSPRRTSKLIVLPGTDGVEPHVAHTTPHHAVFPVARDSAPLLYARKIGSVEHGRASFPEGRLRSLVQPPPPQHLGGFGKALVEALDDDMSRRGRHRDAQHTAGHPCLVHWRRLARKFLGDECPATTRRCRVRQSVGGGLGWSECHAPRALLLARRRVRHDVVSRRRPRRRTAQRGARRARRAGLPRTRWRSRFR